ncbi:plant-specific TFIIB-related protein 1 [Dioscorea cayenensis subsp. rotundata]|uniref:Plant-specific TFIIB-related protein 1 n=1 Tax=Dioscorea cayennensis subsp. rotundata TaxID=55577 RepID=A0AB40AX15_DIOCR|nr:plant-specific TFIIB-related protein 1 [Dioscorea cayenensis subsp. rotundata]
MWTVRCPYCPGGHGRCATAASGRSITECCSCGRVVEERQSYSHPLFHLRATDSPLPLVLPDLPPLHESIHGGDGDADDDPFHPTGFITAFSAFSLEPHPVNARSASSFSGALAELERALAAEPTDPSPDPLVSLDHLRAYLQIVDVSSILALDRDIADHAFQLFRDCSSATCLRNRSVEALATAALVQAIREAQEPRTLQEISAASNLPQKEIGKYIKILGEALKLSQPINSNSIAVHMPRFCTLLQLNKSAQELAAHIGEVVVNKCFCTRRNPISISAAAIYLACQLEDKRKTQAEICKVTGLTEVTLRKVYKELLENWDDLLPPNYTPAVPPEKAFPMTAISSGRSTSKSDIVEIPHPIPHQEKDKQPEMPKSSKALDAMESDHQVKVKEEMENQSNPHGRLPSSSRDLNQVAFWQTQASFTAQKNGGENKSMLSECDQKIDRDLKTGSNSRATSQSAALSSSKRFIHPWQINVQNVPPGSSVRFGEQQVSSDFVSSVPGIKSQRGGTDTDRATDKHQH